MRLEPDLDALGPDAAEITRDEFRERIGRGTAPIKARLLDQSVSPGSATCSPTRRSGRPRTRPQRPRGRALATDELDELRRELRKADPAAITHGGVHTGEVIPYRRAGEHCPRCGAEMSPRHRRRPDDVVVPAGAGLSRSVAVRGSRRAGALRTGGGHRGR